MFRFRVTFRLWLRFRFRFGFRFRLRFRLRFSQSVKLKYGVSKGRVNIYSVKQFLE